MIVQRFLKWCETANTQQRAAGVVILGRAWVENRVPADEREASLAALTLVLDDPSPKVRQALADVFAASPIAPRQIMVALGEDIEDIACLVAARSPVLTDADLVDLFASGSVRRQVAIAGRKPLSIKLAAAIAEVGGRCAASALLRNSAAMIAGISLRRLAERHGEDAEVRAALLDRADIPATVRQMLILQLGRAFSVMPIMCNTLGGERARTIVFDACERATAALAADIEPGEIAALVEHLRISGQLSTAFLIRMVCSGHIDVFAAALVSLCGFSDKRVRAIVVDGREGAFDALIRACGLPAAAAPLLRTAVKVWKHAVLARSTSDVDDVSAMVMMRLVAAFRERQDEPGFEAVADLLGRLETETARESARHVVQRLAAA